jgi:hypothetical protein
MIGLRGRLWRAERRHRFGGVPTHNGSGIRRGSRPTDHDLTAQRGGLSPGATDHERDACICGSRAGPVQVRLESCSATSRWKTESGLLGRVTDQRGE